MDNQLVSVIIPVYKVEKYLDRCVESIVNQTYKNIEILLIDDGSPDNCPKMCDEWAEKDNRIKVIHKQNGGLSDARNYGIESSSGELIMFVDSDDYIELNTIEVLYKNMIETDSDMSCGSFEFVYDNDLGRYITDNKIKISTTDEVMLMSRNSEGAFYTVAVCKLIKKEIIGDVRFPKGRLHEDEFTTYKFICNSKRIVLTDNLLYRYYQRNDSIMHNVTIKNKIDALDAFIERFDFCKIKKPHIYENFKCVHFCILIDPYLEIYNSKEVEKTKKLKYKEKLKEIKGKTKLKHNFKVNMFIRFPRIMYWLRTLKNGKKK